MILTVKDALQLARNTEGSTEFIQKRGSYAMVTNHTEIGTTPESRLGLCVVTPAQPTPTDVVCI